MKKIFLLSILLFQLTSVFGQCITTKDRECMVDITYFKCTNGYKAPSGFEWMQPTKVYFVFGNDTDNAGNYLNTITYNPYNIANGDNLTEINKKSREMIGSDFLGNLNNYNYNFNFDTFSLCIDCGLGYWATVQLLDDFIPGRDSRITTGSVGFPTQGFGYTCGQATAEDAIKVAWESARKMLGKTPKAFNYEIGINAKPQDLSSYDKYRSSGSSLQYQTDYERSDKNFGYSIVPDNVNDFISLVKQNKKYYFSEYDKRDNHPMYGCSFNEGKEKNGSLINYPIFTNKIGSSSKQSGNVQKKELVEQKVAKNKNFNSLSIEDANEILKFKNKEASEVSDLLENLFNKLGYKTTNKSYTGGEPRRYYLSFTNDLFISINPSNDYSKNTIMICGDKVQLEKQLIEIKNQLNLNHNDKCISIK